MKFYELKTGFCRGRRGMEFLVRSPMQLLIDAGRAGLPSGGGNGLIDLSTVPSLHGTRDAFTGAHVLDFATVSSEWIIVSEEAKRRLKAVADEFVQFVPFSIRSFFLRRKQAQRFWVLRVVERIDCIDHDRCHIYDYEPNVNGTLRLDGPVYYSKHALMDYPIATSRETAIKIVRQDVKEALVGMTGVEFTELRL